MDWIEIENGISYILEEYDCKREDCESYSDISAMMGKIYKFLETNAKQFEVYSHTFDGGPAYECTYYAIAFTDKDGKLGSFDFLNEYC